ncbi:MAG: hypothetical protein LBS19_05870 [Clostridiales bacterium]|jgi:hypothetical protein|nr:hypothetical protein [Clostridiales bacterium]
MNDQEYYDFPASYDAAPGTSLASVPSLQPLAFASVSNRMVKKMEHRVETAALQERGKARITQEVITNTCALSAIADRAASAVPSCENDVRKVVSTYASSSAARIARW